jgi:membrane protein required for colicin V production
MAFNWIDAIVALVVTLSLALGAWRGFVFEVLSIAGWVLAFLLARWGMEPLASELPWPNMPQAARLLVAFGVIFVGVAFLAGWLCWMARKLVKAIGVRPVDRLLGAAFGAARGLLLGVVGAGFVSVTPLAAHPLWLESASGPVLVRLAEVGRTVLPDDVLKVLP